jgi:hypothetical protein
VASVGEAYAGKSTGHCDGTTASSTVAIPGISRTLRGLTLVSAGCRLDDAQVNLATPPAAFTEKAAKLSCFQDF